MRAELAWSTTSGSSPSLTRPAAHGVVVVVIDVGGDVGDAHDLPLERHRRQVRVVAEDGALALGVLEDAVAHLVRQVEPGAVALELVDDAQRLLHVMEAVGHEVREHLLAGVAERRVAEVVAHDDRLGEHLVEPEELGHRARELRHLERVRDARAVVIALGRQEDLRLAGEAAERLASG